MIVFFAFFPVPVWRRARVQTTRTHRPCTCPSRSIYNLQSESRICNAIAIFICQWKFLFASGNPKKIKKKKQNKKKKNSFFESVIVSTASSMCALWGIQLTPAGDGAVFFCVTITALLALAGSAFSQQNGNCFCQCDSNSPSGPVRDSRSRFSPTPHSPLMSEI